VSLISVKTCVITAFVVLWGWFFNSTAVPVFFPQFVATPVAGLISVASSFVVWIVLALLFVRHDRSVAQGAAGKK